MPVSPRFRKAFLPIALASGLAVTMTGQAKELSYALGFPPNSAADDAEARNSGVTIHEPSDELVTASRTFVEDDVPRIASNYSEQYGMANADAKIETLRPIVEKWIKLMDTAVLNDAEDLAAIYWEEVLSKVDVENYGQ
jgi:hypothetical protein